jgi:signal transduction histidine kinase
MLHFAYRAPGLQVVLETSNAIIALLVAYLVYGRYRESRHMQDVLLVLGLCTEAIASLALTAVPSALLFGHGEQVRGWEVLTIRLVGTLVIAVAALTPVERRIRRHEMALAIAVVAGVVVALTGLLVTLDDRLPPTVPAQVMSGTSPLHPVEHSLGLGLYGATGLLYAVAAVGFTRKALRTKDQLLRWVGAGSVLAAFARIHYLLFPPLYTRFVYSGDLLRLGFYIFILVGAAREIGSYWRTRAHAAVLDDRRRMARELHDGLTQELAYIRSQSMRLAKQPGDVKSAERITAASSRALDEARRAIDALIRPVDLPFAQALQQVVDELADRYDVKIVTQLDEAVRLDPVQCENLLRITGEAVRNAVRHGSARGIEIRLASHPRCLSVSDDGTGFEVDASATHRSGGFGSPACGSAHSISEPSSPSPQHPERGRRCE